MLGTVRVESDWIADNIQISRPNSSNYINDHSRSLPTGWAGDCENINLLAGKLKIH